MTMENSPAELQSSSKRQLRVDEIVDSLNGVGDEVMQIVKLNSEENLLMTKFLKVLKRVPKRMLSIEVSISKLPLRQGAFTQARIDSKGQLLLTSVDGSVLIIDLSEPKNRELMMAVIGDLVPKFKDFVSKLAEEKRKKRSKAKKVPPPEPLPPVEVKEEVPVSLPEPEPEVVPEAPELPEPEVPIVPEVPVELPEPEPEVVPEAPVLIADAKPTLEDVVAETLEYLQMLADEVFDQSPISVYFDDWLVNLRQVMVGFESNELVTVDDIYTDETEQIYNDIEEELGNRLLKEAELEASTKTLADKKYVLREIDDEYAEKSQNMQVRGKSALDFLIKNVQRLEEEIAKTEEIKTSNFIRKIALKQKRYTLTQKLKSAKHRLSVATENASTKKEKITDVDSESVAQTVEFKVDENSSKEDLVENVKRLEEELEKLHQIKVSVLNPQKKLAKEQKISELTEKLDVAKQLVDLAEQTSEEEKQRMRQEYEKKKQETISNVESLEKEIETKRTDDSIQVRKEAIQALGNAVNALIQRQTEA